MWLNEFGLGKASAKRVYSVARPERGIQVGMLKVPHVRSRPNPLYSFTPLGQAIAERFTA